MEFEERQLVNIETDANKIVDEFIASGFSVDLAKKAAIKTLRNNIREVQLIDDVYMVGLKPRIEVIRRMILFIIER